jgi:hypothetical protein
MVRDSIGYESVFWSEHDTDEDGLLVHVLTGWLEVALIEALRSFHRMSTPSFRFAMKRYDTLPGPH